MGTHVAHAPEIEILPSQACLDEQVSIRLLGLTPGQRIALQASMRDDLDREWRSHAVFEASDVGIIDVSSQKPLAGTYDEIDPMGLFWSLALLPDEGDRSPFLSGKTSLTPTIMSFTAEADGAAVARAELERLHLAPGVARTPVRESGLVGTLFQPAAGKNHPSIIVLGGSDGGLREAWAAQLAPHGYAALALAYFGIDNLPQNLVRIPLEYFETAIDWMARQERVVGDSLGVIGGSRGGELALLLGATFPQIKAVVGLVPSSLRWIGASSDASEMRRRPPAWTHGGKPLPCLSPKANLGALLRYGWSALNRRPIALTPSFHAALKLREAVEQAAIAVERINGPVLLISGQDDQMWPSTVLSDIAIQRLAKHKHSFPYEHKTYEAAGHAFGFPYLPTTVTSARHPLSNRVFALGGSAAANARAAKDAWSRTLQFLGASLGSSQS